MREDVPGDAAATEPAPEEQVTSGWLHDSAVLLTLPADDGEPERPEPL